jgi:hypothetical protein
MKRIKTLVVALAGLVLAAASSHAALTQVNDLWGVNGSGGEWNLYNSGVGTAPGAGIMEYVYGKNYARVNDASDIQWVGLNGGATFDAVYAAASQALYTAAPGGSPISSAILAAPGNVGNNAPSRSASVVGYNPVSQPFLFLDEANGNNAYSDPSLNSGVDRMVTFAVTGYLQTAGDLNTWTAFSDGTTHYVIAFEDGTDMDYNDLVVEVSGVTPVPEPTTMIAGVLLLLPFGASTLRILRKNRAG